VSKPADESHAPVPLHKAATRSLAWTAIGKYSNNLISLGIAAVLTRVLTADDFGLIAMVMVISGFLSILTEAGFSTAVVQKRDLSPAALSSVFWLGLGIGCLAAAGLAAVSPLVARFFSEPRLGPVVAAMGVGFVFVALGRVPNGLLERSFAFKERAIADVASAALGGVVGIVMALSRGGYWALVAQTLVSGFAAAALRLHFARFKPMRVFQLAEIKRVMGYSSGVTAFAAINYWARNLDKALIGRFFGTAELGFYGRAYALMLYPLETINGILNPTLHPLLSELQGDKPRMARVYLKVARLVALIALPAMAVIGSLAPEIVRTVWGPNWGPSIKVFSVLCIVGSVQPVGATFGAVFLATNRTRLLALSGLINACVMMAGMALGVRGGIIGVAIGYSCAYALIFFPTMYLVVVTMLGGRVRDMVVVLAAPAGIAGAVTGLIFGYNLLLRGHWGDLPHLLVGLVAGAATWLGLLVTLERRVLAEAADVLPAPIQRWLARLGIAR
jgi:O-antigen/teichoic acid export membrane protein